MQITCRFLALLLVLISSAAWARQVQSVPDILERDFNSRLQKAVASGELAGIVALYRTNGVTAELMQVELSRWRAVLAGDAKTVSTAFKELSQLPPEAQKIWTKEARRFTEHAVTHIAFVRTAGGGQFDASSRCERWQTFDCPFREAGTRVLNIFARRS